MKKIFVLSACLATVAGAYGLQQPANQQQQQAWQQQQPQQYNQSSAMNNGSSMQSNMGMSQDDMQMAKKIRDKLNSPAMGKGFEQVTVESSGGNVTLKGMVSSQSDKDRVEMEVRKMDGVKSVNNQIQLSNKMGMSRQQY